MRDGNLAVVGWRQNVFHLHYADDLAEQEIFDWTVPNTPANAAVLDIRFGCEFYYPESYSPQPGSTFVIASTPPPGR